MTQAPAPPQLSPDGQWWWDGQQWIPAARAASRAAMTVAAGAPAAAAGPAAAGPAAADTAGLVGLDDLWEPESEALPADGPDDPESPDRRASVSLLLALLWLCGFGSAAAVVLAHQSRAASRRRGRAPSAAATAGLVLGYAGVLGALVAALLLAAAVG